MEAKAIAGQQGPAGTPRSRGAHAYIIGLARSTTLAGLPTGRRAIWIIAHPRRLAPHAGKQWIGQSKEAWRSPCQPRTVRRGVARLDRGSEVASRRVGLTCRQTDRQTDRQNVTRAGT
eukprot:scaffold98150_cov102-Phaeocystis_antarctica.AAC.8